MQNVTLKRYFVNRSIKFSSRTEDKNWNKYYSSHDRRINTFIQNMRKFFLTVVDFPITTELWSTQQWDGKLFRASDIPINDFETFIWSSF